MSTPEPSRDPIIEAMIDTVAELGYPATRVSDVVARAGVSSDAFHERYADKEECFLAAYDEQITNVVAATAEGFASAGPLWTDKVHAGVRAMLVRLSEREAAAKVCIVEVLAAGPRAVARRDAALRGFTSFVDAGRSEAPGDLPAFTATAILGGLYEILYTNIRQGRTRELPRMAPDFVYWILMPFLGPERAARERELEQQLIARGPARAGTSGGS